MFFSSQPKFEHKLVKTRTVKGNNFAFHQTKIFSLKVRLYMFLKYKGPTLHVSKINSFSNLSEIKSY